MFCSKLILRTICLPELNLFYIISFGSSQMYKAIEAHFGLIKLRLGRFTTPHTLHEMQH